MGGSCQGRRGTKVLFGGTGRRSGQETLGACCTPRCMIAGEEKAIAR